MKNYVIVAALIAATSAHAETCPLGNGEYVPCSVSDGKSEDTDAFFRHICKHPKENPKLMKDASVIATCKGMAK